MNDDHISHSLKSELCGHYIPQTTETQIDYRKSREYKRKRETPPETTLIVPVVWSTNFETAVRSRSLNVSQKIRFDFWCGQEEKPKPIYYGFGRNEKL